MRMLPTIASRLAILAVVLTIGPATNAAPGTPASNNGEIEWTVSPAPDAAGVPNLEFRRGTSNVTVALDGDPADLVPVRKALASAGAVAFTINREPGLLTCRGSLEGADHGHGACSFAPDRAFERDLVARHLGPRHEEELLAMALLGVDRALIDGLARQGVAPRSAGDVIAAAALGVSPDYVRALRSAGLDLVSLEDAIACRALDIDAAYVRAMAEAGYRASAEQMIAMKATGVTPEYARRMNAAAQK